MRTLNSNTYNEVAYNSGLTDTEALNQAVLSVNGFESLSSIGTTQSVDVAEQLFEGFTATKLTPILVMPNQSVISLNGLEPRFQIGSFLIIPNTAQLKQEGFEPDTVIPFAKAVNQAEVNINGLEIVPRISVDLETETAFITQTGLEVTPSIGINNRPAVANLKVEGFNAKLRIPFLEKADLADISFEAEQPLILILQDAPEITDPTSLKVKDSKTLARLRDTKTFLQRKK